MAGKKILFVCTSHDKLGNTDKPTGLWAEEMATPYYIFKEASVDVDIVSIKGGKVPIDPGSLEEQYVKDHVLKYLNNHDDLKTAAEKTSPIDAVTDEYDAIYLPGGHGVCFDFPDHPSLIALLENHWAKGKVISAVCHGPAGLVNVKGPDGEYIVKGKKVAGFTNSEEDDVGNSTIA